MASTAEFLSALASFAQESPDNLAALTTLRASSWAMIQAGGGEIVQDISGTLNGKTFTFEVKYDCSELFTLLTNAIALAAEGGLSHGRSSSFDFSTMRQY